jgi:rsbT co-antagonist protein RsbR
MTLPQVTPEQLLADLEINPASIKRRLLLVGFVEEDVERVRALDGLLMTYAEEFVEAFFYFLGTIPEAHGLMGNHAAVQEARRLKAEHLRAMARGVYGADYVRDRLKLGLLYAKAGLDVKAFLGAFHHLMRTVGFKVMEKGQGVPLASFARFMSLKKVAFFDLSLIVDTIVMERERLIQRQEEAIRELSTPVLTVHPHLLVAPIIGVLDSARSQLLTQSLLDAVRKHRARAVVVDITGVPVVDTLVAKHLADTVAAARLMGAAVVISGISTSVSQALVNLGVDVAGLNTTSDLRTGLEKAEQFLVAQKA